MSGTWVSPLWSVEAILFQCRIIRFRISCASSRPENSTTSDISPPKTSRLYSLGITGSGPAMIAEKNPSNSSRFIAFPPLQLLRKSPRRSSSASVSGSFLANVLMGMYPSLAFASARILLGIHFSEPPALRSTLLLCPGILFSPEHPCRTQSASQHVLVRSCEANVGRPHLSPSMDGQENVRQLPDKLRLLLRREHQVAVALFMVCKRGENSASHTEVGRPHV